MTNKLVQDLFTDMFDATKPMPERKPFSHEIVMDTGYDNEVRCGYLSNGSFSVLSGKTGCGKSSFMGMLVASTYKGDHMNIRGTEHLRGKTTLWIDTEMPKIDSDHFSKNVLMKLSGMGVEDQSEYLWVINLTKVKSLEDKRDAVYEIFEALGRRVVISLPGGKHYDMSKVGLVVLDGIADIIANTTDEALAKREIEEYKHYVEKSDCAHITVLHSDKAGKDLVGRFGTLLGQKASSATMMSSPGPGEPTTIKAHKGVRGTRPFRPFEMYWDKDGTPIIDGWEESISELGQAYGAYSKTENTDKKQDDDYFG